MTKETLDLLHRSYQEAVTKSHNIIEIVQNLYDILSVKTVANEDSQKFDSFLDGLQSCINYRLKTFEMTNLVTDITFVTMYIIIWLNQSKGMHIDINLNARRKSLESDLTKLLVKSFSNSSTIIRDRFGLRGIILNSLPKEKAEKLLYEVSDYVIGIISHKNRKEYSNFIEWLDANLRVDSFTKERIKFILSLPFKVECFKDFVSSPKENEYQSLHYTLTLEVYSKILPGAQVELQMRTYEMHKIAANGSASHFYYKLESIDDMIQDVFKLDSFDDVNIIGFTGYDSVADDIDGVHFSKLLVNRRISSTLVC